MSAKVSIIIPVYNAEKYVAKCLNSIRFQKMKEIEIICVDDYSSDQSLPILMSYEKKDNRITVIQNSQNLGAGRCRNLGIEAARGEYLLFMDADDWLFEHSIEKVYQTALHHKADVLRCRALDYNNETGDSFLSPHNALKKVPAILFDRTLHYHLIYPLFPKVCAAPWGGIVKRSFILREKIRFNTLTCVNDRSFFWETILNAKRIVFSPEFLIHYRTNLNDSLVGNRIKNFSCHFSSYQMIAEHLSGLPCRMRRNILNGELLDMIYWLEQSRDTEYADIVKEKMEAFIYAMDRTPWRGNIEKERWYKELQVL